MLEDLYVKIYTLIQHFGKTKLDKPSIRRRNKVTIQQSYDRPLYSSGFKFVVINTLLQYVLKQTG